MNNRISIIKQQQAYWKWLGISLLIPLYFGLVSLYFAFNNDYVVQDDARQHVVWLQRYIDPTLFPNDAIADYFTSVAPLGYKSFYWFFAHLGIEPIILAKILPLLLAIIATYYLFLFSYAVLPLPISSFWSCLFFNQLIWLNDDLISATPRAFIYPLFAAFLYYFSKRSLIGCLVIIELQGLFYPQMLMVELATILVGNIKIKKNKPFLVITKSDYLFTISTLVISCVVLLPYILIDSSFEPIVNSLQMKQMPEFNFGGRSQYFHHNPWLFWLDGSSGLSLPNFPPIVWISLAFPWIVKNKQSITQFLTKKINIIYQVIVASLVMFFIAHILLPELHLPSRYTYHSFRFIMAITTGIIITLVINKIFNRQSNIAIESISQKLLKTIIIILLIIIIMFPAIPPVFINWFQNWQIGNEIEIYQYLSRQPSNIIIASLSSEADNIPAFTNRSILVSREFAIPYHTKYYEQFQEKTMALVKAQYSFNLKNIQQFISKYGITYFLLDTNSFTDNYLLQKDWLINSSFRENTETLLSNVNKSRIFALQALIKSKKCVILTGNDLYLLEADCITNQKID